jgi:glycosyltransferase involved in cell wall biosynthesis
MPKVSIVIPVYNVTEYLTYALTSVLSQTFTDYEVLIIDDGSLPQTAAVLDTYASYDRVQVHHIPHSGVSRARNIGIERATGTCVAFLDADDAWMPRKLERQVAVLESRPNFGVVYTNAEFISTDGTLMGKTICEHWNMSTMPSGNILEALLGKSFIVQSTVMARRTCFAVVGKYDESLRRGEDWQMFIRLAKQFEFAFLDEVLVHYRRHPQSVGASSESQLDDVLSVVNAIYADPDLAAYQNKRMDVLVPIYLHEGVWHLRQGQPQHARDFFMRVLRERPSHLFALSGWCLTWLPARRLSAIIARAKDLQLNLLKLRRRLS